MGDVVRAPGVSASLLSCDMGRLGDEAARLEAAGADLVHLDVMDGIFVPELTFGAGMAKAVCSRVGIPVEAHLMVSQPDRLIEAFAAAGCSSITVHVEATAHLDRLLQRIHELGASAGVALNPSTPVESIEWAVGQLDLIVVMTVNPGYGGQEHLDYVRPKIGSIRRLVEGAGGRALIEIDGGVCADNAAVLRAEGADILVAGSFLARAADPASAVRSLR
jgi:ribulose-phosphate 3-epimerase